ncbi:MAG: acyl-CoA/acyl-ACP dehydrogenase [Planctomycetales bacterium]|nr:acyl-CoA/acyl-ACP dehydrogenase [Planctomycetales bacterium]
MSRTPITSPDSPALTELCGRLAAGAPSIDASGAWLSEQLRLCGEYGVYEWFVGREWGGQAWTQSDIVRGYLELSGACLTTTFVITQRTGASRRIETSENQALKEKLLPGLVSGESFATVGISHLTTSRRHLAKPVLRAKRVEGGWLLDGFSPWVTGADHAEHVVVGATVMDGDDATDQQLLVCVPTTLHDVTAPTPLELVALSASHTGQLHLDDVFLAEEWVVLGPAANVMTLGSGGNTGGYQTSTLALGLAKAAIALIARESEKRSELKPALTALADSYEPLQAELFAAVDGTAACSTEELRTRANSLALRSAQAALVAAKGAGYVAGHPAGRWCREALFFLVWSCPQPVLEANLCELAGIFE